MISVPRLRATTFAETLHCYGHHSSRCRFRSTVVYPPSKMTRGSYSQTQFILPKRLKTTYVSYVCLTRQRRLARYQSTVDIQLVTTVNSVADGGFRYSPKSSRQPRVVEDNNNVKKSSCNHWNWKTTLEDSRVTNEDVRVRKQCTSHQIYRLLLMCYKV